MVVLCSNVLGWFAIAGVSLVGCLWVFGAVGLGFLLVRFCLADFSGFLRGWYNIRFRVFCSDGVLLLGFVLVGLELGGIGGWVVRLRFGVRWV